MTSSYQDPDFERLAVDHVAMLLVFYRRQMVRHDTARVNGEIDAAEHECRVAALTAFVGADTVAMWAELDKLGGR